MEFTVKTLEDTKNAAFEFAKTLTSPAIVAFRGGLGAGKTTFIRYVCQALGYTGAVTSPTFAIMNCYDGDVNIYHYDMYRVYGADALYDTGFYDFENSGISLIEWSENVADGLEGDIIYVTIDFCGEFRKITIKNGEL